jgi:hypothetical protein
MMEGLIGIGDTAKTLHKKCNITNDTIFYENNLN